jgi:hypothetical protein
VAIKDGATSPASVPFLGDAKQAKEAKKDP